MSRMGVAFDEVMAGPFAMGAADPEQGAALGKAHGTSMVLRATITVQDVERFAADPEHGAALTGALEVPGFGALRCREGSFSLLRQSGDPRVKLMVYVARVEHLGAAYCLVGRKLIHDGASLAELLDETTTLYARLHQGVDEGAPVVGAGILEIGVAGTVALVASMRPVGAGTLAEGARAIAAFGAVFFGELWETYSAHVPKAPSDDPPLRAHLAKPAADLVDGATAEVVIIGSGYGAGVAARRLARAGRRVVVLERGKEWRSGELPRSSAEAARQLQLDSPGGREGAQTGLYDLRVNPEVDVLLGCGLGGTSLINANVAVAAEPEVFDDPRWPAAIARDRDTLLADGYARARAVLRPVPYPSWAPQVPKAAALHRAAAALHRAVSRPPLCVTFVDEVNSAGLPQRPCQLCGDCVSGCNYEAKTTVDVTYLADAKAHGAELYVEVTARWIERDGDGYRVLWRWSGAEDDAAVRVLRAQVVIIAAGALGSTELLLRSAARGLALSARLGANVSSNADYLSFGYNGEARVGGVGHGEASPRDRAPVGPAITTMIEPAQGLPLRARTILEEGAIPGVLAEVLPAGFAIAAATDGANTAHGVAARLGQAARVAESLVHGKDGAYRGATANTQTFLGVGHDDGAGTMALVDDRLRIAWPGAGTQDVYRNQHKTAMVATESAGGILVRQPMWKRALHHNLITVHPLGGCPMGEDAQRGVVDDRGRVYVGTEGVAVHDGLYVVDGSIVPTSLGRNPLLTICALAERAMTLLLADRGWEDLL